MAVAHGEVFRALNGVVGLIVLAVTGTGLLLTGALVVVRIGRLALRYGGPRLFRLAQGPAAVLFAVTVGLTLVAMVALAIGFVKQTSVLVHASLLCSFVAALTLASFALVGGGAKGRPSHTPASNPRVTTTAPPDRRRATALPLKGGSNDAQAPFPIEQYAALRVAEILPLLKQLGTPRYGNGAVGADLALLAWRSDRPWCVHLH
jgi:hypothetical protein